MMQSGPSLTDSLRPGVKGEASRQLALLGSVKPGQNLVHSPRVGMLLHILMYAIPAGAIVMVGVAYWSGHRSPDAKWRRNWDEFREADASSRRGRPPRRMSGSIVGLLPLGLLAFVAILIGGGMLMWSNALMYRPWRVPVAFVLVLGAIAAWAVGRRFDPAGGRLRCPKCWYDYSALGGTDRCPECGNEPRNLADLRRTRHSRGLLIAAPMLLVGAWLAHTLPVVARTSWRSFVPTDVLIWGFDGLSDTLIIGTHEPGSLVDRYRSGRVTMGQLDTINELGTRMLAYSSDVETLDRACELTMYADWSMSREVVENVPRTVARAMRETGLNPPVDAQKLNRLVRDAGRAMHWADRDGPTWRDDAEAREQVEMLVAGPMQSCAGILATGLAVLPPEENGFLKPIAAAAEDPARTEGERVASAVHLGYIVASLESRYERDARAMLALDGAEPLIRHVAEIASHVEKLGDYDEEYDYDAEARAKRGVLGAAREAMESGDAVRARAGILALRPALAQGLIDPPNVQRISELDAAAMKYPELRGEALKLAAELGLWAAGFDEVIKEGLESAELSRRREVLALIVQTPDGRERYEGMIEKLKAEAEADPARADEARTLRRVLFPGVHE